MPRCGDRMKRIGKNARPNDDGYELAYWDPNPQSTACSMSGWPESFDRKEDFELVEPCSDAEHRAAVARWDKARGDHRWSRVMEFYGHVLEPIAENKAFEVKLVREFHRAFEYEAPEQPRRWFENAESSERWRWTDEEISELIHALTAKKCDLVAIVDGMADLAYYCAGTLVCLGVRGPNENDCRADIDTRLGSLALVKNLTYMACELSRPFRMHDAYAMRDQNQLALMTLRHLAKANHIPWEACFGAVHAANMRKLHADGKCHRNALGKTIKPAHWYGPERELRAILREAGHALPEIHENESW